MEAELEITLRIGRAKATICKDFELADFLQHNEDMIKEGSILLMKIVLDKMNDYHMNTEFTAIMESLQNQIDKISKERIIMQSRRTKEWN